MKIIAKVKDYYDYLQGIYGVDEKLVLDRTKFSYLSYPPLDNTKHIFYIGGYIVEALYINKKFHFGPDIEQFQYTEDSYLNNPKSRVRKDNYFVPDTTPNKKFSVSGNWFYKTITKDPKCINDKMGYPILYSEYESYKSPQVNPILKDFEIAKFLPAEEIWKILTEWLSNQISKKETQVPTTDKEKIVSHGFGLKESFRHRK